jgi:hypothetical protein
MKVRLLSMYITILAISSITAQNFKFGKVSEEELVQKAHAKDIEAPAAILYRNTTTDFKYNQEKGFYAVINVHERIKIYKKEGGSDWATIEIPLFDGYGTSGDKFTSLTGFTYVNKNGKIEKTKLTNDGIFEDKRTEYLTVKKFTMPKIEDGVVIEYRYTVTSPFIQNIDTYYFQETIPVNRVEMSFWAPEYLIFKSHRKGLFSFNVTEETKRERIQLKYKVEGDRYIGGARNRTQDVNYTSNGYKVALDNLEAIREEPYTSNLNAYRSGIQFELSYTKYPDQPIDYYSSSWEDVARDINKSASFGQQLESDRFLKRIVESIVDVNDDQGAKVAKIYQYVKSTMTWNGYKGIYVSDDLEGSLERKSGNVADINLLCIGLMRAAGIPCNPVLISTKENGIPLFPTRTGFDYVVAGVGKSVNPLLLDAADRLSAPQVLNAQLLNWFGRSINQDGTSFVVDLFPQKIAKHTAFVDLNLTDDMEVQGTYKSRISGHLGQEHRRKFVGAAIDSQLKMLEQSYENTTVSKLEFKELENPFKPLSMAYHFSSEQETEEIGGKIYVNPMVIMQVTNNYFLQEERSYPIDFEYPRQARNTITWKIPTGYRLESVPENLEMNLVDNIASYKYSITQRDNDLQISVIRSINKAVVDAKYYQSIKEYFKRIINKESEKLVLVKL